MNPVIAPEGLMPLGKVPWPAAVPAPGASNVVMVVLVVGPAFTERPSPNVQRTRQSTLDERGRALDAQTKLEILVRVLDRIFFMIRHYSLEGGWK
jgi:hypothetical protein